VAVLRRALDAGLNVLDTAPSYEDGFSEEIVGEALRARREGVFLVDKVDHLDRPVEGQVADSLRRLGLPAVDLLVLHAVSTPASWAEAARAGGRMEELAEERRRGRTRHVGVSSHHPEVLGAALASGLCDVVMFPLGPFADRRYAEEVLPEARRRGVGTICFKAFGAGKLLGDTEGYGRPLEPRPRGGLSSGGVEGAGPALPYLSVEECLSCVLTLDPDVALLGLSSGDEQDRAFAAAEAFRPMPAAEISALRSRAAAAMEGKGAAWWDPPP
jgi:aryl-alcohol dehydrogenase-like predicted oxidoreductase